MSNVLVVQFKEISIFYSKNLFNSRRQSPDLLKYLETFIINSQTDIKNIEMKEIHVM